MTADLNLKRPDTSPSREWATTISTCSPVMSSLGA
jgi:hypothetical protein